MKVLPAKKCKGCGIEFIPKKAGQEYHSQECGSLNCKRIHEIEANRPYTGETKNLIRLWFSKGDSVEKIAIVLGRSVENVNQALIKR